MKFSRVLIAVDNSANSKEAAQSGFQLAQRLGAEVALVFVIEIIVNLGDPVEPEMPVDIIQLNKENGMKTMQQLIELFSANVKTELFTPQGIPKNEILTTAADWNADIIVVGTHSRTGLSHLILGSTSEYVVRHSKVPVMVVPLKNF
ncbi:MAG TPA: universal stress protein [Bacteroidia bacterium]|nr:universal stress protein [Bacteroidia bacterium]